MESNQPINLSSNSLDLKLFALKVPNILKDISHCYLLQQSLDDYIISITSQIERFASNFIHTVSLKYIDFVGKLEITSLPNIHDKEAEELLGQQQRFWFLNDVYSIMTKWVDSILKREISAACGGVNAMGFASLRMQFSSFARSRKFTLRAAKLL